ncbi:MAG: ABC transporter substrate-binding protein [Chloroflexi bacterium]|jgi:branched-chain amino acid transport system substrate-binding protein|nr:ABC transporter substrate-binding protein [Chloroflexota bacterium]
MNKHKFWSICILTGTILALITSCVPQQSIQSEDEKAVDVSIAEEKEPIRIGVAASFSGPIAYVGEGYMMGATLALEELGGKIAGYPIQFYTADNACNPEQATSAIRKLVDVDEVHLILGSGCSSCTLASMPLLEENKVAQITGGSTAPEISEMAGIGGNIWEFRVNASSTVMAEAYAPYIAKNEKSVFFMAFNDDYGRGAVDAIKPLLQAEGVEILGEEYFERGTSDVRPILLKIKEANPSALLLTTTESDAITILRQFKELGLSIKIYGYNSTIVTGLFTEMTPDEPGLNEGILEITWWAQGMTPEMEEAFLSRWGTEASPHRAIYYFIVRYVVKEAIELAAQRGEITRESLRDALNDLSIENTPIGPLEFDDNNQAHHWLPVYTMKDGVVEVIEILKP